MRPELAGRIRYISAKRYGRYYVVYVPSGSCFEGEVRPALMEPVLSVVVESIDEADRDQEMAC